MSNPDCYSENVGKFQLKMIGAWVKCDGLNILRFQVLVIPDGENEREILSWDTFERACYFIKMIKNSGDWKNYQDFLAFLNGK